MSKAYEEKFVSPFEKDTWDEAFRVLQDIRSIHSPQFGWEEIRGFVEELPNGKFRAVRYHRKVN